MSRFITGGAVAALALAACAFAGSASAQTYNRLVVFGDSLSDNGNLYLISGGTQPPSPPYYQGRFSSGRVWTELLGFNAANFNGSVTGSINYAFGGSRTDASAGVPFGMLNQLSRYTAAPINIEWGYDNRTVGIRSPISSPEARRLENRVIGADANPYLAMAMTLACGYLGMKNKIKPKPEMKGDAYLSPYALPRSLGEALDWLRRDTDLHEVLGKEFITVYTEIKELEFAEFMKVISPWEREHLLLHV